MAGVPLVSRPVPSGFGSFPAAQADSGAATAPAGNASNTAFLMWVAFFGVVLPAIILGGLHAGRFRFVFVGR